PESGQRADMLECPLCAKSGLTHRSKKYRYSITSSARASNVVGTLRPMPLLGGRLILGDQAEQEMHVPAVGSAFRRLGSIGSPHLAQVPYVLSDIRFRAASILWISVVSVFSITSSAS